MSDLPPCLIITGVPGAGKTTVTGLLAARFARSARLDGDDMYQMIVNGHVGPVSEPADEAQRQLLLRARNLCSVAVNFAQDGFTTVIDHVVPDRDVLAYMVERLPSLPVRFVVLAPPLAVAQHRNATRDPQARVDFDYSGLYATMGTRLDGVGWWLDTAAQTPEETVEEILAYVNDRGVIA